MARIDQPQDPLFARINTSVGFDRRLWREDIEGSRVHAGGLARAGVITADELAELERGLEAVAAELDAGELPGTASTVIDFTGEEPRILREGAGSSEQALAAARLR